MSTRDDTMVLGINGGALGGHLGGWRHRDSFADTTMRLEHMVETAVAGERGKFDFMFLADGNGVRQMDKPLLFAANSPSDRPSVFEPVTLYAALSQHTKRIGFVATATTSYEEPFMIARKFASLDHLSGGRAAWNLVTTQYIEDAKNFNRDEHMGREERYERARESLDVVRQLWDSWAEDAFTQDKSTGQYLDPARVRLTSHRGKHFGEGALNVARTPQGQPVVFMAGQSDDGKELAAYGGEGLFGTAASKVEAQAEYADIKGRMPKHGRPAGALKILPGLSIYTGRTTAEADELYEELQSLISPALGVSYLSKIVGLDLVAAPLDGPMPERPAGQTLGGTAIGRSVLDMAEREKLTVRKTYERVLPAMAGNLVKGTPAQVADFMEDWFRSKACDGFILSVPVQPRSLTSFVELLVPELERRGLRSPEYRGKTLRENMGLATPADPFA